MRRRIDLTGQNFGRLTVIRESSYRSPNNVSAYWICLCDCGQIKRIRGDALRLGITQSCGCLQKDVIARVHAGNKFNVKHGEFINGKPRSRLYRIWDGAKGRCNNPNNVRFHRYGGRGIKMSREWRGDFLAFKHWALSSGYHKDLTIDRINNDGNYEPSNCRWITKSENSKKRGAL